MFLPSKVAVRWTLAVLVFLSLQANLLPGQDFVWAGQLGGPDAELAYDVTADAAGNVYVAGYFHETVDFDPGPGVFNLTSEGDNEIFVVKLDSAGDLLWAKRFGSTDRDYGSDIAVDATGNVYVTGWFSGAVDFDPGEGVATVTSAGGEDIFVLKLNANGDLVWAKGMGSTGDDEGYGITVDGGGNVYVAGEFTSTADFDPGSAVLNLTAAGEWDAFVVKLTSAGELTWARRLGGSGFDTSQGVAVDAAGNVYTNGSFKGRVDFNPGPGSSDLTSAGEDDAFVSKLDSAGAFVWARRLGGSAFEFSADIAVDGSGNVYTTGLFRQTADFDPSASASSNLVSAGMDDAFISKLNSAGDFVWARRLGGSNIDSGHSVKAVGSNVYVSGRFSGNGGSRSERGRIQLHIEGRQ